MKKKERLVSTTAQPKSVVDAVKQHGATINTPLSPESKAQKFGPVNRPAGIDEILRMSTDELDAYLTTLFSRYDSHDGPPEQIIVDTLDYAPLNLVFRNRLVSVLSKQLRAFSLAPWTEIEMDRLSSIMFLISASLPEMLPDVADFKKRHINPAQFHVVRTFLMLSTKNRME